MNKLEFINHSCVIISNENTSIVMDPWIDGSVFNNSWNLLVKTPDYLIERLKKVDYVWFSHEHPDHFNPKNLTIFSKKTKFLFQETKDKRVVNYLSRISPNVKELSFEENFYLDKSFSIQAIPFQYLDSMSLIKINNFRILNLNDCDIKNQKQLQIIKNLCGSIDLLMIQFSYAIGKSNKENKNERSEWSLEILNKLSKTISFLQPKNVLPFASFCYFSRKDNFYLNDSINKIGPTIEFLNKNNPKINFFSFYPGDSWDFKSEIDNKLSIKKYENHYNEITPIKIDSKTFNLSESQIVAKKFIENTKDKNNLFYFYNLFNKKFHKIFFNVTDLNSIYEFNFTNGLIAANDFNFSKPYCSLSSESLYQLFNSGYGYDALIIGGRFEANKSGLYNMNKIFKFQAKNYQNIFYNYQNILSNLFNKFTNKSVLFYKRDK